MPLTPYQCVLMVLDRVKPDMKEFVEVKINTFNASAPITIKWADFLQICKKIKDKAIIIESNHAMAAGNKPPGSP